MDDEITRELPITEISEIHDVVNRLLPLINYFEILYFDLTSLVIDQSIFTHRDMRYLYDLFYFNYVLIVNK